MDAERKLPEIVLRLFLLMNTRSALIAIPEDIVPSVWLPLHQMAYVRTVDIRKKKSLPALVAEIHME